MPGSELENWNSETLGRRIADAFSDGVQSRDLPALIQEVRDAADMCAQALERTRRRALEPTCLADVVIELRKQIDDLAFKRERMAMAVARLNERMSELSEREEDERRRQAYERAEAERDALAAELAVLYPPFAERLGDLLERIKESNRQLEHINRQLPRGAGRLQGAELLARRIDGFVKNSTQVPQIVTQLRMPTFWPDGRRAFAWPRTQ